jgi:hypothetical protein
MWCAGRIYVTWAWLALTKLRALAQGLERRGARWPGVRRGPTRWARALPETRPGRVPAACASGFLRESNGAARRAFPGHQALGRAGSPTDAGDRDAPALANRPGRAALSLLALSRERPRPPTPLSTGRQRRSSCRAPTPRPSRSGLSHQNESDAARRQSPRLDHCSWMRGIDSSRVRRWSSS